MKNKTVLLTGSSGFIGRNVKRELISQGYAVKCIDRNFGFDFKNLTTEENWKKLLDGVEAVINCCGIYTESTPGDFELIHTAAPIALFNACEKNGPKRVIHISVLHDSNCYLSNFVSSKRLADSKLISSSLDWFILRPSIVYGDGGNSMQFMQQLSRLPLVPVFNQGRQLIQPVYISDLVEVVILAIQSSNPNQIINVVGDQPITMLEWLTYLRARKSKRKIKTINISLNKMILAGKFLQNLHPLFSPEGIKMLQCDNVASSNQLAQFLGRKPMSVEEGICLF